MRILVRVIDSINEWTGKMARWACVALVMVLAFETTMRYAFNNSQIWVFEVATMLGVTIAALGWGYTYLHDGHVRVDVFYARLSPRGKAISDIICSLIFLFPFLIVFIYSSASWMWLSWSMHERLLDSGWIIPAGPIKTVIVIGLILFALQGVAEFIRALQLINKRKLVV